MKTNTFIFNFINPSRLAYFAEAGEAAAGKSVEVKADRAQLIAKLTKSEDSLRQAELKYKTAATLLGVAKKKNDSLQKLLKGTAGLTSEKLKSTQEEAAIAKKELEEATRSKDTAVKSVEIAKSELDKARTESIIITELPEEQMVGGILDSKKADVQKLLGEFAQKGYSKGESEKWNSKILDILGKTDEPAGDKKKWIEAFQKYVGAEKIDAEVGPRTMIALAEKLGETNSAKKIEGAMIARKAKKSDKNEMIFSEEQAFTEDEKMLEAKAHYAKAMEFETQGKYEKALAEYETVYRFFPDKRVSELIADTKLKTGNRTGDEMIFSEDEAFSEDDKILVAKAHYAKAMEFEAQHKYKEALAEYETVYRFSPIPLVLKQIGDVKLSLDDRAGAMKAYQEYLKNPDKDAKAETKAEAEKNFAALKNEQEGKTVASAKSDKKKEEKAS